MHAIHRGSAVLGLLIASPGWAQTLVLTSPTPDYGGLFGNCVSGIPDVNGDGRGDVVVGAFGEATPSNPNGGRVHLFSGSNGALIRTISPPTAQFLGTFGWAVAGTPDMTGDGRGDVLIGGMWESDNTGLFGGRAYLYSGATGQLVRAWISPNRQDFGCFGWAVGWVPDLSGDGVPDVIIAAAAERSANGFANAGRVYIYSGATGAWLRTLNTPNPEFGGFFGSAVAGVPDLNGDGRGDVVVGAPLEDPGLTPTDAGRAYVYSGATGGLIRAMGSAAPQFAGNYGSSVAGLRDINGDGAGDVAVGAPGETPVGFPLQAGAAYVYSGATGVGLRRLVSPAPGISGNFGLSIASVPDMNFDARDELVVGALGESGGAAQSGRAYVFSVPTGPLLRVLNSLVPSTSGEFGYWVAGIPDANGDGRGDIIVGAAFEDLLPNSGLAYLFR